MAGGPEPDDRLVFEGFAGGENVVLPPGALDGNTGSLSYDTDPYTAGALRPRMPFRAPTEGATSFSSAGLCLGLVEFVGKSNKIYTVAVNNEGAGANAPTLREMVLGTGVGVSLGSLPDPSKNVTEYHPQMVEFGSGAAASFLIVVCGDAAPQKFTQAAAWGALGGSPPTASYVEVHKNRVWLIKADGQTLQHSALNNGEDYTTANDAGTILMPNFGETCTGLKSDGDIIYVFYPTHIVAVRGDSPFTWIRDVLPTRNGCISAASIVRVVSPSEADQSPVLLYAGFNGFYAIRARQIQPISNRDLLNPSVNLSRRQSGLTNVPYPWIFGCQHKNVVWWTRTAIEGSAGSYSKALEQTILSYTIETGTWREHNPATAVNGVMNLISYQKDERLLCMSFGASALEEGPSRSPITSGATDATIPQDNNATKVPMKWRSGYFTGKGMGLGKAKIMRRVYVEAAALAGKVKITPIVDGTAGTAKSVTVGTGSPARKVVNADFGNAVVGRQLGVQVEVDVSTTSQSCEIGQIEVYLDDQGSEPRRNPT